MDKLSLTGDLEKSIVLEKICAQSRKDETGRRRSFRITTQEIKKAVEERIEEGINELLGENEKKTKCLHISKRIGKRKNKKSKHKAKK